jgi:hypothetical protein
LVGRTFVKPYRSWPHTFTKINAFQRGVLVAFNEKDGATTEGEDELYLDHVWIGGVRQKKRVWRAQKLPGGTIIIRRHRNRTGEARRL